MRPLLRHFFGRFFDNEIVSPGGDIETKVVQWLSLLAVPGLLVSMSLLPFPNHLPAPFRFRALLPVHCLFVSYSMIVMGIVTVVQWDALFPDRRDYIILMPLPIRLSRFLAAKFAALVLFLGLFAIDINLFSTLLLPPILATGDLADLLALMFAHAAAVLAGGAFMALAVAGIQGILINLLPTRAFRTISPLIQMALLALLVITLCLYSLIASSIRPLAQQNSPVLYWVPMFWYLGLYEVLLPDCAQHEVFASLAQTGGKALLWAGAVFLVTYLIGYRRHTRRVLESVETGFSGPGRLQRALTAFLNRFVVTHPVQRASFYFISQTIARSVRHRLFLAVYGGVGVSLAALALLRLTGRPGELHLSVSEHGPTALPLTLSFVLLSGLRAAFNLPAELRANWVFQITEDEHRAEHLAATRKWVIFWGLGLLFALFAPFEFRFWPRPAALSHLAFGFTLSLVLLQVLFYNFRKVPFTCSYFPGKMNLVTLCVIYLFGYTSYSYTFSVLERSLTGRLAPTLVFFGIAFGLIRLLSWGRDREIRLLRLDYEDVPDPVVRTLNLT